MKILPTMWSAAMKCGGVSEEEEVLSAIGHHVHTNLCLIWQLQSNNSDTFHLHVLFDMTALLIMQHDGTGWHAWDELL